MSGHPFRSAGDVTAIDREDMPDDEAGGRTAQPQHGRGDLIRMA
jgi:hypothetical protein